MLFFVIMFNIIQKKFGKILSVFFCVRRNDFAKPEWVSGIREIKVRESKVPISRNIEMIGQNP